MNEKQTQYEEDRGMKEKVAQWLNAQADIFRNQIKYHRLDLGEDCYVTSACMPSSIAPHHGYEPYSTHAYGIHLSDINPIAKILDLEIKRFDREDWEYDVELQFVWDGVVFFSIYKTEELEDGNTDISNKV